MQDFRFFLVWWGQFKIHAWRGVLSHFFSSPLDCCLAIFFLMHNFCNHYYSYLPKKTCYQFLISRLLQWSSCLLLLLSLSLCYTSVLSSYTLNRICSFFCWNCCAAWSQWNGMKTKEWACIDNCAGLHVPKNCFIACLAFPWTSEQMTIWGA